MGICDVGDVWVDYGRHVQEIVMLVSGAISVRIGDRSVDVVFWFSVNMTPDVRRYALRSILKRKRAAFVELHEQPRGADLALPRSRFRGQPVCRLV